MAIESKDVKATRARLVAQLRDVRYLFSAGRMPAGEYALKTKDLRARILKLGYSPSEPESEEDRVADTRQVVLGVLRDQLKISPDPARDGWKTTLGVFVPREVLTNHSIQPVIEYLETVRNGFNQLFDRIIQQIRDTSLL